jgi:DNA (cytosine-5)-methyltransferase 1
MTDLVSTLTQRCTQQQIVTAHISKLYGKSFGEKAEEPLHTITGKAKLGLVTSHLVKFKGTSRDGQDIREPLQTVQAGGQHYGEVRAFLMKYYGEGVGSGCSDPVATLTSKDRMGLVTVMIEGEPHVMTDIGMRMLSPKELFLAQGFGNDYQIDVEVNGKPITKQDKVRLCGNSVPPHFANAIVTSNFPGCGAAVLSRGEVYR